MKRSVLDSWCPATHQQHERRGRNKKRYPGYVPKGKRVLLQVDGKPWCGYAQGRGYYIGYAIVDGLQLAVWSGGLAYAYHWKSTGKRGARPEKFAWLVKRIKRDGTWTRTGKVRATAYTLESLEDRLQSFIGGAGT